MIALWMLYATVISTALGAAAAVVDRTAGSVIRSRRWIWVAAVVLSGAIPVTVALAPQALPGVQGSRFVRPVDSPPVAATSESSIIAARIADLLAKGDASVLERFDRPFAIGWGLAVLLAFAAYGAATFSLARRRRTWRSAVAVTLTRSTTP